MKYKITKSHIIIASFILIYAAAVLILQSYYKINPPYSANDSGPFGTKAFFLLSGELGFTAKHLENGLKSGSHGVKELLVVVDQPSLSANNAVGSELTDWVRSGGNLLLFTQGDYSITRLFGITVGTEEFRGLGKVRPSAFTKGVRQLNFEAGRYLSAKAAKPEILAEGSKGPVSLTFPLGRGRVIVVSDPSLITNSKIQKYDHVILLSNVLRVIQPQTIWFDETGGAAAGEGDKNFLFNETDVMAVLQFGIALILLFIYWGKRFGRPLPLPDGATGVTAQYINTMANIFRQAKARDLALDNIYAAFWHDLTKSLGVPDSTKPAEIINLCLQRPNLDSGGLQRITASVEKIQRQGTSTEAEIFALVHDMEIWRRENLKNARG